MTRHNTQTIGTARIVLHGHLRERFGAEYNLGVPHAAAAIHALVTLVPGFREAFEAGDYIVRRGGAGTGYELPVDGLRLRLPPGGEVHIIPAARGSKQGSGAGKIIAGAVLMIAAVALMQPEITVEAAAAAGWDAPGAVVAAQAGGMATPLVGGLTVGNLAMAGGALMLTGILQVLSPQPKTHSAQPSHLLSGQGNVTVQGVPVPVVYGRMRTGSVVASVGYEAVDFVPANYTPVVGETFAGPQGGTAPDGSTLTIGGTTGAIGDGSVVTGSGGSAKGSGGGDSGTGAALDTLHSKAIVRIVDVLGEGPIGGLVDGAKSIYFNDTPLQAADGSFNFRGINWWVRLGNPDQDPIPGFPASETSDTIGAQVKQATPVVRVLSGSAYTAARVTIRLPSLYSQDRGTGYVGGTDLSYLVEVQPSLSASPGWTGSWVTVAQVEMQGMKTMSAYQRSHRFALPTDNGADTWSIRVSRLTEDSNDIAVLQNDLYWDLLDAIVDHQIMYTDTALIAYEFDSQYFGSQIPSRQVEIYGRTVNVPANYTPATRTYYGTGVGTSNGTWDLVSTIQRPSDNPAWVLLDLLSSTRYGCGIPAASRQELAAELYVIAQYSDALVPDGFGSSEARYAVNTVIASQTDAYQLLQLIVSAFRGMTYWGAGRLFVTADMPKTASKIANQTNVIDGDFEYSGTSQKTRPNLVRVTYLNAANRYIQEIEAVSDPFDIAERGVVEQDITAWGCTSRGRAHRLGKWALYTAQRQNRTVTYKGGWYHADSRPGMIVHVADPAFAGVRTGGRLRAVTSAGQSSVWALHLDSLYAPDGSASYTVSVVMPDATVDLNVPVASFTAAGTTPDYTIVHLNRPLAQVPSPNAEFVITSQSVAPRPFQILSMAEAERGTFAVTAVNYEVSKFNAIELGTAFDDSSYSALPALYVDPLAAPANVSARDYMGGVGASQSLIVTVSWTAPRDPRVTSFEVRATGNSFFKLWPALGSSIDLTDIPPGLVLLFSVRSLSSDGRVSSWVDAASSITVDGKVDPPIAPTGLAAVGGTRRVQVLWSPIAGRRDIAAYEVWRGSSAGAGPGIGATLLATVSATSYLDAATSVLLPNTTWYYWVRGIASASPPVQGAFAGPASGKTTLLIVDDLADGIINTAKFAQSLAPVSLLKDLTGVGQVATLYLNEADHRLYKWVPDGSGGSWQQYVQANELAGQLTSDQIAGLAAAKLTGQITKTQIGDKQVDTPQLNAGAVNADKLAAGAVTTEHLSVGSGTNLIWNSCLLASGDGWVPYTAVIGAFAHGPVQLTALESGYFVPGLGTGYMTVAATFAVGDLMDYYWAPSGTGPGHSGIPVKAGDWVEGQAMLAAHRCAARTMVVFYDQAGTNLGEVLGSRVVGMTGDVALSGYGQSWVHAQVPAGATRAMFIVRGTNDGGADFAGTGTASPYVFFTQTAFGLSTPKATGPAPWTPGGIVEISGGMVRANTITGDRLVANTITAGQIQAGAISATEIATGSLHANLLASDFQLTSSAQIGTAVITTAHIGDLQVDTINIANSAVTNIATAQTSMPVGASHTGPGLSVTVYIPPGSQAIILAKCSVVDTSNSVYYIDTPGGNT